jgi:hypothetical protein
MEVVIAIIIIAIMVVIIVAIFGGGENSAPSKYTRSSNVVVRPQAQRPSSEPFPIEGLIGLLILGGLGLAAISFIKSGGLTKLLNEIGKIPINVNGEQKDIATALKDDTYVRDILREALLKKINEASRRERGLEMLSENTPQAATDVAQMLREALDTRMKRGRI